MNRYRRAPGFSHILLIVLLALGLSACDFVRQDRPRPAGHELQLATLSESLFIGSRDLLDHRRDDTLAELDIMLGALALESGHPVMVQPRGQLGPDSSRDALLAFLVSRGLRPVMGEAGPASVPPWSDRDLDGYELLVTRLVVIPPACPDWSIPMTWTYDNQPSSNFGCATQTNLGSMLAYPEDLLGLAGPPIHKGSRIRHAVTAYEMGVSTGLPVLVTE